MANDVHDMALAVAATERHRRDMRYTVGIKNPGGRSRIDSGIFRQGFFVFLYLWWRGEEHVPYRRH